MKGGGLQGPLRKFIPPLAEKIVVISVACIVRYEHARQHTAVGHMKRRVAQKIEDAMPRLFIEQFFDFKISFPGDVVHVRPTDTARGARHVVEAVSSSMTGGDDAIPVSRKDKIFFILFPGAVIHLYSYGEMSLVRTTHVCRVSRHITSQPP